MAKLKNRSNDLIIELNLYPDPETSFKNWITYEIKIKSADNEKILLELSAEPGYCLYLEACYEAEIPVICDSIIDVIKNKKESFFFEPIDQKDFQLYITKEKKGKDFFVGIYSKYFDILETHFWNRKSYIGIKMHATEEALLDFVKQLTKEYKEIISKYPKDDGCVR